VQLTAPVGRAISKADAALKIFVSYEFSNNHQIEK